MHERQHLYINGNWIEPSGEGSIEVINPTNEEVIGYVPVASDSDADAAVQAARSAFAGWSTTEVDERVEFLNRISSLIKDRSEELAKASEAATIAFVPDIDASDPCMADKGRWGTHASSFHCHPDWTIEQVENLIARLR